MKKIVIALLCIGLLAGAYGLYLFNKTVPGVEGLDTDMALTAKELFEQFEGDAQATDQSLNNKVIEVEGPITKLEFKDSVNVLSMDLGGSYTLNAALAPKPNLSAKVGDVVKLKGYYVGYLPEDKDFEIPGEIKMLKCIVK